MTKSPIASRTRSKGINRNGGTKMQQKSNDKKNRLIECHVRLNRLTKEEIMRAVANDLTKIVDEKPKYNLRIRNDKKNVRTPKVTKKSIVSNAVAELAPTNMTVTQLWKYLKKEFSTSPLKNLCCLAKMRMYSPWPAMVMEPKGKTTTVYFFGEGTTGTVQTSEIVPFQHCSALAKKYLNIKNYLRAVRELEIVLNVPQYVSITNTN